MPPFTSGTRSYGGFGRGGGGFRGHPGFAAVAQRQEALRAAAVPAAGRTARTKTVTKVAAQKPSREVLGLFTEAMKRYQPGGGFGRREEALLARAKKKYLASSAQRMVSAGLGGTTVPMAEEAKFEEERGDPFRAGLEETRTSRLNELLMAKAGYLGGLGRGGTTVTRTKQQMPQVPTGRYGGGYGGGGPSIISGGGDPRTHPSQIGFYGGAPDEAAAPAPAPPGGTEAGFRQLPKGGRIVGDYYYPPTRFTRNRPEDVVPQEF